MQANLWQIINTIITIFSANYTYWHLTSKTVTNFFHCHRSLSRECYPHRVSSFPTLLSTTTEVSCFGSSILLFCYNGPTHCSFTDCELISICSTIGQSPTSSILWWWRRRACLSIFVYDRQLIRPRYMQPE